MRASPVFSETSVRPSLVRTTAVKKPRTEWGCQPVAFMTAAMVAPCFRWSIASTRACFESERPGLAERRRASFPVFTSWASVSLFGDSFFDDIVGILHSVCSGVSRRHHRSPAQARKPAGQDPQRALALYEGGPVTLCSQPKSSPFWINLVGTWLAREWPKKTSVERH